MIPAASQEREPVLRLPASSGRIPHDHDIQQASIRLAWVNGLPGAVLYDADWRVASVMELDTVPNGDGAGVIQAMHVVVNPDKLGHLGPVSDVARLPGEGSQR